MMSATWRGVSERGGRRTRGARGGGGAGGSAKRAEPDHAPASPPRTQHTRTTYSPPASSSSSWNWLSFPLYTCRTHPSRKAPVFWLQHQCLHLDNNITPILRMQHWGRTTTYTTNVHHHDARLCN